ncbi:MAG: primosomal protein N', partial [Candidatus Peregrinibacteria bacterium]|nr:primosomal protein N' [Candidatus Peregrinibacteria bacterium]
MLKYWQIQYSLQMYAEIVLPMGHQNQFRSLTYRIPEGMEETIKVGSTAHVSMRNRTHTGLVIELHDRTINFAAKDILTSKDTGSILSHWQIELARWIADYYMAPLYTVFKVMLPGQVWNTKRKIPYLQAFERTKIEIPAKMRAKQLELIKKFEQKNKWAREELSEFSLATFRSLEKRQLISEIEGGIKRAEILIPTNKKSELKTLSPEQKKIKESILNSKQQRFLIHGVTGSGKTEIYLQVAQEVVKNGKQVILMAPEISLTPQLIEYFSEHFGNRIAVLHSQLSQGEREREWWRIQTGEARVVIGSRSAVFAPTQELGLIIMDEEHEWSYKQDSTPFYHARSVAFEIAKLTNAKVVLGSATPSIETMYSAQKKEIEYFELKNRILLDQQLPNVELVDMREELQKKNMSIFSDALYQQLQETFARKKQAILFLNR